jgi:NAD(P)H-dependent FMN reductase
MDGKLSVGIVIASVRPNRLGEKIATWFRGLCARQADLAASILDLRDFALPNYEDPRPAFVAEKDYPAPGQRRWIEAVNAQDAFVIVTPEYNHSFPGALKNALDHAYAGFNGKPVGFIAYGGGAGGVRAVEQLRLVCIELQMAPVRAEVNIAFAFKSLDAAGGPTDALAQQRAELLLKQIAWWGHALKAARAQSPYPAR